MKKILPFLLVLFLCICTSVTSGKTDITHLTANEARELTSENYEIVGYPDLNYYEVRAGDSLYLIARKFDTTVNLITQINRLDTDEIIAGQKLLIPDPDGNGSRQYYEVQTGDTLFLLAQRFNTTIDTLKNVNDLETNIIYPGQILRLENNVGPDLIEYTVLPGESLYLIARKFNTTISNIMTINNFNSNLLYIGQTIYMPAPDSSNNRYTLTVDYRIQPGDSFNSLARRFNISAQEIRTYNNINYLHNGQLISLPFNIPANEEGYKLNISNKELDLLARAVHSEARGEPFRGQVAVAAVIINRIYHPFFPNNVTDVIFQPWQFTAVHDGQFWLDPGQTAYVAAKAALKGWDPSREAIFYYNPNTASSGWIYHREVVVKIGEHYFAVQV
ncbi:MAG: LysM peptidoglycan-binding domain-containing protein [Halanaerobiaceae bacterium]